MNFVLLGLGLSALYSLFAGWLFMLAVGLIHHEWIEQCPTIGLWWAILLAMLIRGALHSLTPSSD